jgi:hypothetical protein
MARGAPHYEGPGRQFRTFFLAVCLDIHERAGGDRYGLLVDATRLTEHAIKEFEKGKTFPTQNLNRYAAGYAALDPDISDPRLLFDRALNWWNKHGKQPLTIPELSQPEESRDVLTPLRIIELARNAEASVRAAEPPISKDNRRAGSG